MTLNFRKDKKKIDLIQKLNSQKFNLLEKIVDRHINIHKFKLHDSCLIRLFRFEIIRFYSDYISKYNEKKIVNDFPKFNFEYLFPNIHLRKKKIKVNFNFTKFKKTLFKKKKNFKIFLIEKISTFIGNKITVGIRASSISTSEIILKLLFKRYRIVFMNDETIDINYLKYQKKNLESLFKNIDQYLNIPKNLKSSNNLFNIINMYISNNSQKKLNKIDILLTGTLIDTINRIVVFNSRNRIKKIKVISIAHGHQWIWDEQFNEIPEYEYSDYYLSYGVPRPISKSIKNKLLYKPRVIGSSCEQISDINKQNNFSNLLTKSKLKYLYVPREYQIIGPLPHFFSDKVYNKWHKYLLKSFKKVDLTIKTHPKAKTKFDKIFFKKSNKIEENKYIDNRIFEKYDVFIFDSFTSAFTKVAATNKHIIFFNLNERKCVKKALRLIKKRTNFFDMNQIVKLNIAKVKLHTKKNYNKEFINQYSLYKNVKRSVSLIKLIDSIKVC
jgi:hypothetical protein